MSEMTQQQSADEDWFERELGKQAVDYVRKELHYHLFKDEAGKSDIAFRIAPSIVARSECELLAVSAPRFAVRVYFRKNGSFANLRRLPFLEKTAHKWGYPASPLPPFLKYATQDTHAKSVEELLAEARKSNRYLADSFFVPTDELTQNFDIVTTQLHCAYGEHDELGDEPYGVPFVQHMKLGGGMCAQAVCFAATTLLHEYAAGIHGVAEITALAQGGNLDDEATLAIGGCTAGDICSYFRHEKVGLACIPQSSPFTFHPFESPDRGTPSAIGDNAATGEYGFEKSGFFESLHLRTIRAYVRSGMPVIACVDVNRVAAKYLDADHVKRRELVDDRTSEPIVNHAILIVGAGRKDARLLVNDPAQAPFHIIDHESLWSAVPAGKLEIHGRGQKPGAPLLLPVTPRGVRLSLLDTARPVVRFGLITMCAFLWKTAVSKAVDSREVVPSFLLHRKFYDPGQFLLTRPKGDLASRLAQVTGEATTAFSFLESSIVDRLPEWCWIQCLAADRGAAGPVHVVLWDATRDALGLGGLGAIDEFVCLVLTRDENGLWNIARTPRSQESADGGGDKTGEENRRHLSAAVEAKDRCIQGARDFRLSILSSVSCAPFFVAAPMLKIASWCDAYVLMQSEREVVRWDKTAVEFMAENVNHRGAIASIAERLQRFCENRNLKVAAFASFVPTLAFPNLDWRSSYARLAVCFLVRLAHALGDLQQEPVRAIEFVAGSRITGIWPAKDTREAADGGRTEGAGRTYAVSMMSDAESRRNLIDNLSTIHRSLESELTDASPVLALELEPGPLFAIRDWQTVQAFCHELPAKLRSFVGLNLDCAHWNLGGITPAQVATDKNVYQAIAHVHLSGHHRSAHFGDIRPLLLNEQSAFRGWLDLASSRMASNEPPRFSGAISLELEAAKGPEFVERAFDDMKKLVFSLSD